MTYIVKLFTKLGCLSWLLLASKAAVCYYDSWPGRSSVWYSLIKCHFALPDVSVSKYFECARGLLLAVSHISSFCLPFWQSHVHITVIIIHTRMYDKGCWDVLMPDRMKKLKQGRENLCQHFCHSCHCLLHCLYVYPLHLPTSSFMCVAVT